MGAGSRAAWLRSMRRGAGGDTLEKNGAAPGSRYRCRMDGEIRVPDPASRCQAEDVHGASEVIAPTAVDWQDDDWRGRPWGQTVLYELHVGSFTEQGSFAAVQARLDYLAALGVTAVELMPVADFPGRRDWGYDGVFPFGVDRRYGRPDELKALVQAAHARELMVFLDVVYNHFGPEGNYLHRYAPAFFTERHHTPWGAAINFDGEQSHWVRQFFIHNALYWLEEFHFDGLRLDAVHAIIDDSRPDILEELASAVRHGPGRHRHIHLVLENDDNAAHYLERAGGEPKYYVAQWNDDIHHALHVLATGERGGYYRDYADAPIEHLERCLAEGFAYQGEPSRYREGATRGEPSGTLPPSAFVSFVQNHDQVGNRAFGERLTTLAPATAVRAVTAVILLAPAPPLLFMGQEWGNEQPFPFFCNFGADLAEAVTEGRRREFARFPEFADPAVREKIPDPMAESTFASAILRWDETERPAPKAWLEWHRNLLRIRHDEIIPRLVEGNTQVVERRTLSARAVRVQWRLGDGALLTLSANLGAEPLLSADLPPGRQLVLVADGQRPDSDQGGAMPPWSVSCHLLEPPGSARDE